MIAGCIDRMRNDACTGCPREDPCRALFAWLFRRPRPEPACRASGEVARSGEGPSPFRAFFAEVARAVEAAPAPPRPSRFRFEVEAKIEALLERGEVRIGALAASMGMSRQTLYRRLKAEESSFEALLDGVRRRLGVRLIAEGVAVKEAAWRLGFSDPSAFSRAYKRWTGRSPRGPRPPR